MWRPLRLLLLCCALSGLDAPEPDQGAQTLPLTGASPSPVSVVVREAVTQSPQRDAPDRAPTAEPLEEEFDNQENVISQLLGDYDKVKTVSSGSDCVCRCIVRPIKRADCSRIHGGDHVSAQEHYTVETITKGTDCKKCVCMAPPSAVNPCEGEYRFKKLQEASKDDIKLATIIDLLEGSLYGMDLLKLQSVTTKLLTRVDNMEKAFARNFTERAREKERMKEKAKEKEKKAQQKKKKVNDLERVPQKSGAAAYANKQKKYEEQLKKNAQQDGLEQPTRNKTGPQKTIKDKMAPKPPIKEKNSLVIRGVTFYKAEESYAEEEDDDEENKKQKTILAATDFQIDDQFQPTPVQPLPTEGQAKSSPAPTQPPTTPPSTIQQTTVATTSAPTTIKPTTEFITSIQTTTTTTTTTTTAAPATTHLTSTTQPSTTIQPPTSSNQHSTVPTNVDTPSDDARSVKPVLVPRSRLSWTESPADQPKTTKKPGVCKDTLASISEPVQQNSYGLRDGAWMRDARGHGNVIYLTNDHFGSNLQEFRDLQSFKSGQSSNSYKLPYSYTGTGHVVYNGAFYYNRAFSRDIIRYDLRHRYVAAWTTLHDALLEEQAHKPQSEVEFAVDESGLWLLYPALDTEGFHQEVILLIHINSRDLQPIQTFRTGLRRGRYGNSFLVCGVLYAVDSMERHYANVTYAFDTHTLTHTMPSLAFTNMHMHTSQLAYCPLDKKLYAWDNGHQMIYDVIFAY